MDLLTPEKTLSNNIAKRQAIQPPKVDNYVVYLKTTITKYCRFTFMQIST